MDQNLVVILVVLICFGLVMLYSVSSYMALVTKGDSMYYFKRQGVFCVLGFVTMFFFARFFDYKKYARLYIVLCLITFASLAAVPFVGVTVNGAKRWLPTGISDINWQPAELAKIAIIVAVPAFICELYRTRYKLKELWKPIVLTVFMFLCVYKLTDNLSSGIIVLAIGAVIIFIVNKPTIPYLILVLVGLSGLYFAKPLIEKYLVSSDGSFRVGRLVIWANPEKYAASGGYQIMQALYAIGSGGLFGKGLGNSAQKMGFIPEAQNDMILSIICEELGIVGLILVLLLFTMLLFRLRAIAQNAPDLYSALVVSGIFAHISLQVLLNVAVVINLVPTTGITLPFISYGGTSMLFTMCEMGLALGISARSEVRTNDKVKTSRTENSQREMFRVEEGGRI
jgi:cell division protein FtsW